MSEEITSFRGKYHFLSNFHLCRITLDGAEYPSLEHAFQASKCTSEATMEVENRTTGAVIEVLVRTVIRTAKTPGEAKRLGREILLRPDWEDVKVGIMLDLLRVKFANPVLVLSLLNTGDAMLIEGNTWVDTFWGVCGGVGKNVLGTLLMIVRSELRMKGIQ